MKPDKDTPKVEKLELAVKIIILCAIALGFFKMPTPFYEKQRLLCFILFVFLIIVDAFLEKYISTSISFFGVFLFNPFFKLGLTGFMWDKFELWLIVIINLWIVYDVYRLYFIQQQTSPATPWIMKRARYDAEAGIYIIQSSGYIYEIPPVLIDKLKEHFEKSNIATIADWHLKLPPEDKKTVVKRIVRSSDMPIMSKQKIAFR